MVVSRKMKLPHRAAVVQKQGYAWPMTRWVAVAEVGLDRYRELEAELVQVQLGSMWELAAA